MNETRTPPPFGTPPPAPGGTGRVLRRRDGHAGGVAAGVGHYLDVDPNLVRVGFVLLTLVGGSGIFLYLAGWLFIPTADEDRSSRPISLRADSTTAIVGAVVLTLAAWLVMGWDRNGGLLWPLLLVAAGVWLLNQRSGGSPAPAPSGGPTPGAPSGPSGYSGPSGGAWPGDPAGAADPHASPRTTWADDSAGPGAPAGPAAPAGPGAPAGGWPGDPGEPDATAESRSGDASAEAEEWTDDPDGTRSWATTSLELAPRTGTAATPAPMVSGPGHFHWAPPVDDEERLGGAGAAPPPPPGTTYDWAVPHGPNEPTESPRPARPPVLSVTLAVLALAIGTMLVLDTVDAIEVSAVLLAATAFVVVTAGLVVGVIVRRARGLVALTVLASLGLLVAPVADMVIDDGMADRVIRVHNAADLESEYRLGVGNLVLDLRTLDPADLGRALSVDVGIGRAEVIVPDDALVRVDADSTAGYVEVLGQERDGTNNSISVTDGPSRPETLDLDVDVRFGALQVRRG